MYCIMLDYIEPWPILISYVGQKGSHCDSISHSPCRVSYFDTRIVGNLAVYLYTYVAHHRYSGRDFILRVNFGLTRQPNWMLILI